MRIQRILICFFMFIFIMLTGCSKNTLEFESIANHKELVEESEYGEIKMEFSNLDGENVRSFNTEKGEKFKFDYKYLNKEGTIELQFKDSKDNIITEINISEDEYKDEKKEIETDAEEEVKINEFKGSIEVKSSDNKIKIVIIGQDAEGKINITW